jgi:hypothetical protein
MCFKALSESASSVTKRERSRTGCSSKPSYASRGGCTIHRPETRRAVLDEVNRLAAGKGRSVQDARRYIEAMLGFEVYCHRLFQMLQAPAHHGRGGAQSASVE